MKKEYPQIVLGLVFTRQVALVMLDRLAGWRLKKLVLARIAEMDGGPLVGELGEPEIINCLDGSEFHTLSSLSQYHKLSTICVMREKIAQFQSFSRFYNMGWC